MTTVTRSMKIGLDKKLKKTHLLLNGHFDLLVEGVIGDGGVAPGSGQLNSFC